VGVKKRHLSTVGELYSQGLFVVAVGPIVSRQFSGVFRMEAAKSLGHRAGDSNGER